MRILSIEKDTGCKNLSFLAIDKEKRFVHGTIDNKLIIDDMLPDKMIQCIPSEIEQEHIPTEDIYVSRPYGISVKLYPDDSYINVIEDDISFPTVSRLTTKIRDIGKLYEDYVTEGVVLNTSTSAKEFFSEEDYKMITYTNLGDDTGQIRLIDERDPMNSPISRLNVGDRIKVVGVQANSHYSKLMKKIETLN